MRGDLWVAQFVSDRFQGVERPFLVRAHQPRIAGDIGREDRGEAAGLAHVASPIASRRPDRYSSRCPVLRR